MADLLNENRFITISRNFSRFARFLITLIILSFTVLIWLFFFYLPTKLEISEQEVFLQNFLKQNEAYKIALKQFNSTKNENVILNEELKKTGFSKNNQNDVDLNLKALKQNNLCCSEFKPINKKQNELYKKEYYSLKINGNFGNIISFLQDLKKSNSSFKLKNTEIKRKSKGRTFLASTLRIVNFL